MDKLQINSEKRDSITVKKNAKGEYAWDIKVYFDSVNEPHDEVVNYIKKIDVRLRQEF